jgi:hypothetical protein
MQVAIKSIANVPERQLVQMLSLHRQYYTNVKEEKFLSDFREKTWCIVVSDDRGQVQGYSTLQWIPVTWEGAQCYVLFSGNTLMDRTCWNLNYIAIGFSHISIYLLRRFPGTHLLWLLISKGHRTYRFLPVFFHLFYPSCDGRTPPGAKPLLDHVCRAKFGARYDARRGVVVPSGDDDFLNPEMAETPPTRLKDPHVAFFLERNPGYARGEELACLAPLAESNVHAALLRRMLRAPVEWSL